ncbi:Chitinase [Fusarium keratoplasticum]|uniref:Chitinase n=1 Tax=Fusarium keratoplasticum TaxID=1328300 RepID=A0ACC0QC63_9HYPO|nr:Chitinase [Fusarium keratoplasticum]KAI8648647.1 Chitinase [Fusarium keratoplasticum]
MWAAVTSVGSKKSGEKTCTKEPFLRVIFTSVGLVFICPNVDGKLKVYAEMSVEANVNYGFTLIGKLGGSYGIDISDSYLYYRTGGNVNSKFVIDAAVTAHFDTGDVLMFSADTFGAAFTLEGKATLGVNFETKVKLAEWDVYQTFPAVNKDWEPDASDPSARSAKQTLEPEFEYGVSVSGHISAHVKPTITFGIDWNEKFTSLDSYAVNLVADGHVTFHAEAKAGSSGNSFCYGIDVGADLYATLEAPKMFSWALPKSPFMIMPA